MSTKKLKSLTINFEKWGKGYLVCPKDEDEPGHMCCLGFVGRTCGLTAKEMDGHGAPADSDMRKISKKKGIKWPSFLLTKKGANSRVSGKLMEINDDENYDHDPAVRMALIANIFEKNGTTVRFTNVPKGVAKDYKE